MSRTDVGEPQVDTPVPAVERPGDVVVTAPREVPLGGLRAMTVRRTLPSRHRTTIGPWCFLDHYGPDPVSVTGGMQVAPHPHTGLQTVSWLFEGAIHHRDSTGSDALVQPGELHLMTAGHGIQHSEISTPETTALHGVQLWVAMPEKYREQPPHFDVRAALTAEVQGARVQLITGDLPDVGGVDAPHYWPLVAAQIDLAPGQTSHLRVDESFEHGLLLDHGQVELDGDVIPEHHLGYLPTGRNTLTMTSGDSGARVILIGGQPFEEELVMWWNFVGRTHEDVEVARTHWQEGLAKGSDRFGHLPHMEALPAPEMPSVRLKARPSGSKAR